MKEFDLMRLLGRYWLTIILVTAIVFGLSFLMYRKQPPLSYGAISLTVQAVSEPVSGGSVVVRDQQLVALGLTATTQSWLSDSAYSKRILDLAGVQASDPSIKGYSKQFKVVSSVGNSLDYQILYSGSDEAQVTKVFAALKQVMNELKDGYNAQAAGDANMAFVFSEPITTTQSSSVPLTPIAGLVVGFVFSLVTVAFLERKPR